MANPTRDTTAGRVYNDLGTQVPDGVAAKAYAPDPLRFRTQPFRLRPVRR